MKRNTDRQKDLSIMLHFHSKLKKEWDGNYRSKCSTALSYWHRHLYFSVLLTSPMLRCCPLYCTDLLTPPALILSPTDTVNAAALAALLHWPTDTASYNPQSYWHCQCCGAGRSAALTYWHRPYCFASQQYELETMLRLGFRNFLTNYFLETTTNDRQSFFLLSFPLFSI
jgi:hypothetical protein